MKKNILESNKGITLVALVITIIVLLILAGVTISLTIGENGLINRSKDTADRTAKAQAKEEIEFKINEIIIEKNNKATREDIAKGVNTLEGIYADIVGNEIEGEYKDYSYKIDENNNVIMGDKLTGAKPTGRAVRMMNGVEVEEGATLENVTEMEIKVTGELEGGSIAEIRATNGAVLNEEKSTDTEKIFTVNDNKIYKFLIKGDNKRSITVSCEITNIIVTVEKPDIFTAIEETTNSGVKNVIVNGKLSNGADKQEIYGLNIIRHEGNLVLDGTTQVKGAILDPEAKRYEFGNATKDVGTASGDAQRTVVLKVEGDLTINENVTLTSVKSAGGYGGPKGMIVYCTGTLTNNGTISMTARGAKAVGQNVYLLKNENGSYEYVPKDGANGGGAGTGRHGGNGANANNILRMTGGRWGPEVEVLLGR